MYPYAWDYPAFPVNSSMTLPEKTQMVVSKRALIYKKLSILFLSAFLIFAIFSYGPSIFFWAQSYLSGRGDSAQNLSIQTSFGNDVLSMRKPPSDYQPRLDTQLSKDNWLIVPSIGIKTQINEALDSDFEDALKKGVWRVPEFGTPFSRSYPTIFAAHRFGYIAWSNSYRHYNSFYNLPKLNEGDTVEVVWNQRKYVFAIYGQSEGEEITDYSADLILYTCLDLSSNVRVFKYAKLLEI